MAPISFQKAGSRQARGLDSATREEEREAEGAERWTPLPRSGAAGPLDSRAGFPFPLTNTSIASTRRSRHSWKVRGRDPTRLIMAQFYRQREARSVICCGQGSIPPLRVDTPREPARGEPRFARLARPA